MDPTITPTLSAPTPDPFPVLPPAPLPAVVVQPPGMVPAEDKVPAGHGLHDSPSPEKELAGQVSHPVCVGFACESGFQSRCRTMINMHPVMACR